MSYKSSCKYLITIALTIIMLNKGFCQSTPWTKYYDNANTSEFETVIQKINQKLYILSISENYQGGNSNGDVLPTLRILNFKGEVLYYNRFQQGNLNNYRNYEINKVTINESRILVNGICTKKLDNKNNNYSLLLNIDGSYLNSKFDSTQNYTFLTASIHLDNVIELYSETKSIDSTILHSEKYNDSLNFINQNSIPINNLGFLKVIENNIFYCKTNASLSNKIIFNISIYSHSLDIIKSKSDTSEIEVDFSQFYNYSVTELDTSNGNYILYGRFYGLKNNPKINGLELDYYNVKIDSTSLRIENEYYSNKFNSDANTVEVIANSIRSKEFANSSVILSKVYTSNLSSSTKFRVEFINNNQRIWYNYIDSLVPNISTGLSLNIIPMKSNLIVSTYIFNKGLVLTEYDFYGNKIHTSIDSLEPTLINSGVNNILEGDSNTVFVFGHIFRNGSTDSDLLLKKIYWKSTGIEKIIITRKKTRIYPNPAYNQIQLLNFSDFIKFEIFNSNGNKIQDGNLLGSKINIEVLLPGIYFIKLYTSKGYVEFTTFVKSNP